jgi:hypothetical protein
MKNFLIILFLLTGLSLESCYHPTPIESFVDLQKLEGNWTSYEGAKFNESWVIRNDSLMKGIGFSLNGNDTVFAESLLLRLSGDSVFYGALVGKHDGFIYFKLEDAGRNHWKFINPDHDYPNIIEYALINDTLLEASTSNIRGNKRIVFKLKRVSP